MRLFVTLALGAVLLAGCTAAPVPGPTAGLSTAAATTSATPTRTPTASPSWTPAPTPAITATTPVKPLAGRRIVVDPGHNGLWTTALNRQVPASNGFTKACNTSGTAGGDYAEHAFAWQLATVLVRQLRAQGATVVLTRPNDTGSGPCVNVRAAITNRAHADALVSLHADGNTAPGARGYHIIVSSTMVGGAAVERASVALARALRTELDDTGLPRSTYIGGGTAIHRRTDIAGLNLVRVPGVMLELGNMRDEADLALQRSASFRAKVARAIVAGLTGALA